MKKYMIPKIHDVRSQVLISKLRFDYIHSIFAYTPIGEFTHKTQRQAQNNPNIKNRIFR